MKVLYILPTHNASAALFEDGKCLSYIHEEKFNNIKNYWGFPKLCLDYLDQKHSLANLDQIVFSSTQLFYACLPNKNNDLIQKTEDFSIGKIRDITNQIEYKTRWTNLFFSLRSLILDKFISTRAKKEMTTYLCQKYQLQPHKILFIDHHTCHALSPIHFYNLHLQKQPTLVFTMDGSGDNSFAKIFIYNPKNSSLREVSNSRFDASLGLLYSGLTQFLGMKPNEHEYKVMGLAAYVSESKYYQPVIDKLQKEVYLDEETLSFKSTFNTNYSFYFFKQFTGLRFDNLSAAVQQFTENLVLKWVELAIKKYKISQVAFSGGVFMNVKLNKKIQEQPFVKKAYFMPSCGDESLGYGAVFKSFIKKQILPHSDMSMYHGLSFTDSEIEKYFSDHKISQRYSIKKIKKPAETIAKLLSERKIVSWFQGKGEWGARSLCNRTILANASDINAYHQVNDAIKMRDFWMPFAPTISIDFAEKYIKDWKKLSPKVKASTKYMITAFDTTAAGQKDLLAAIHQKDRSIRPQIVEETDNPPLYSMLSHFAKLTGMGGLMNTSLNIHGYPLVGSLEQAFFTMDNSHLEYMVIENYLVVKK